MLAYLITWSCHAPFIAHAKGLLPFKAPLPILYSFLVLGTAGPIIAALILTGQNSGSNGIKLLLSRLVQWRVRWYWYLLAVFSAPVIKIVALGVLRITYSPLSEFEFANPLNLLRSFIFWMAVVPLEEVGWRGFALPRLQTKYSALTASLILGLLWGVWHLPILSLDPGRALGGSLSWGISLFMISIVLTTIYMTWIYNNTDGSLLPMVLIHAAINTDGGLLTLPQQYQIPHTLISLTLIAIILGFIIWTPFTAMDRDSYSQKR